MIWVEVNVKSQAERYIGRVANLHPKLLMKQCLGPDETRIRDSVLNKELWTQGQHRGSAGPHATFMKPLFQSLAVASRHKVEEGSSEPQHVHPVCLYVSSSVLSGLLCIYPSRLRQTYHQIDAIHSLGNNGRILPDIRVYQEPARGKESRSPKRKEQTASVPLSREESSSAQPADT